jgi:serine/threonine-protein kinase
MATDDLSPSLIDAVADRGVVDWEAVRASRPVRDSDLLDALRVISAIGATGRQAIPRRPSIWSQAAMGAFGVIVGLAGFKVALAAIGAVFLFASNELTSLYGALTFYVMVFGISGAGLVVGGGRDRRVRRLGVLFLVIASAFCSPLLPDEGASLAAAPAAWTEDLYPESFLPLAFWLFVAVFPTESSRPAARRLARIFSAATAGVGMLLLLANVALQSGVDWPSPVRLWLAAFDRASTASAFWPLLLALAIPALPFLMWKSSRETHADRRRVRYFVGALAAGLSPMVLAVVLTPFVTALRDPAWRGQIGVVLHLALASVVPVTAYAVVVDRIMEVNLVIHKTAQYALARTSVWCASVLPLAFLVFDVSQHQSLTLEGYLQLPHPMALLAVSFGSFVILTFRHEILNCVDRWFLRDAAGYAEALARFERDLRSTRTIRETTSLLKRELDRTVRPSQSAVLLRDPRAGRLVSLESAVPALGRPSILLEMLGAVRAEIQIGYKAGGPVAGLLPDADKQWLDQTGLQLFFPLTGSGGTLLGLVALGPHRNGLPYTPQDHMVVTALSGQAALRLENDRLKESSREHRESSTDDVDGQAVDWDNEPAMRCTECGVVSGPTTRRCSCGGTTTEAALPLVVKGKFRVDRFLGAGGTGVVYLAVDLALDRKVAIKTLPAVRLSHAARLSREARAMASVLHPNLALIYGAEQWKGTPLLVFEYLEGGTLLDSLKHGPIPIDEVIDLGTLLADALERVHASRILHRDIKPSNIGYTSDGVPKLLDFGLAAILDRSRGSGSAPVVLPSDPAAIAELAWGTQPTSSLTLTQQLIGTPLYLSPEALWGQVPEPSFDLWSLSLVLYQSAAGRHPLAGLSTSEVVARIRAGALPDIRDLSPGCPALFAAFLNDSLSPVAARRPASAADLRNRLRWLRRQLFPQVN